MESDTQRISDKHSLGSARHLSVSPYTICNITFPSGRHGSLTYFPYNSTGRCARPQNRINLQQFH